MSAVFDILYPEHISYLQEVRFLGDCLNIAVNEESMRAQNNPSFTQENSSLLRNAR